MTQNIKNKLAENARHLRFISRAQIFQKNRNNVDQLDYFQYYTQQAKQSIIKSIQDPVPQILPPLSPITISFYRRKSQAVFCTKFNQQMDGHMIYQSLYILSSLQQKQYDNYQLVVKQFEQDLCQYLQAKSQDIRQMSTIAAGNKIIGKENDILKIVQNDRKQLWVLVNHIYEKKISIKRLFPFMKDQDQIIFKTLYELSNSKDDEIISSIAQQQNLLSKIIQSLKFSNNNIAKYCVRIIGNLIAEKNQYSLTMIKRDILSYLKELLMINDFQLKRDICWLLSNLACHKVSSTHIIKCTQLMEMLGNLYRGQGRNQLKKQITYVFSYLVNYAQKNLAYQIFVSQEVLNICHEHLCIQDNQLNIVTLQFLHKLIDLCQNYNNSQNDNRICRLIISMGSLKSKISEKSYCQNSEISELSQQIKLILDDYEE